MIAGVTELPRWLVPMAATLTQVRFTGPEWLFERKFDGIRLIAFKDGAEVRLYSRTGRPQQLPEVAGAIARLPPRKLILDGELDWDGGAYHVFDLLWRDDRDLRPLPLDARRAELEALPLAPPLERVVALADPEPWRRAGDEGWEGVVAKRRDSPYEHKRSRHWLKMKCEIRRQLTVGGFTDPKGKRVGLGALLLGFFDERDFAFAGKVGTGLDGRLLLELRRRLDALEVPAPPFTRAVGLPRKGAHWVRPEIVVEVAFIEWTRHRKLRHPRLLGVV
jgi:ATP-dependent DNA ligase